MPTSIDELPITLGNCVALATEVWRLNEAAESFATSQVSMSVRYSVRQLNRILEDLNITILNVKGRPYEAGLIQEVVDVVEDDSLPVGKQFIEEVVAPTIAWRGQIVQPGQITIRRSSLGSPSSSGATE
jgi:hypothetical protein